MGSCTGERGGSKGVRMVRNHWTWVAYLLQGHGGVWDWAASKGHVYVCSPA